MLGDGSLIVHKSGKNAYISYCSKSYQHVKFVADFFKEFITDSGIRKYGYLDNRTNKVYSGYSFKTHALEVFTEHYNRWYINGKRHYQIT